MAVTEQKLKTGAATAKTRRTTKGKELKQASRVKTACKDGVEQLHQAADKQVYEISEKLAEMLKKKALKGDLASAKTLVGLAERKKPQPEPKKKRRGPSMAERLAAEPEWEGEEEDRE